MNRIRACIIDTDTDTWVSAAVIRRFWLNCEILLSVWCQHREYRQSELVNFAYRLQQFVVESNGPIFLQHPQTFTYKQIRNDSLSESNRIANRNALLPLLHYVQLFTLGPP